MYMKLFSIDNVNSDAEIIFYLRLIFITVLSLPTALQILTLKMLKK